MCFATAAAIATVAGTAVSAVGSISQGASAAAAAQQEASARNYQAAVARNNAIEAEQQAQRQEMVARNEATRKSMETAARVGRIKAGQAASGVDVNTGSAVDVQAGTRAMGKLDTDTVFSNEMLKAYGYRSRAQDFRSNAELDLYRAKAAEGRAGDAMTSGYLKAGGTLLSSMSSLPLKWGGGGDKYTLGDDTLRTAGDRDLAGYS